MSHESEANSPRGVVETGWSKASIESQIGDGVGEENVDQMSEREGEMKGRKAAKEEKNDEKRGRKKKFWD